MPSAGKHDTVAKHGKTSKLCQNEVLEIPSPGKRGNCKHITGSKRGKTCNGAKRVELCNRCQARETVEPVPSAGKYATGAKVGKLCNTCQALENIQLVQSAGKRNRYQA